jgi:hypothetical protein
LEGGPPRFPRDSSCPAVLRYPCHRPGWCFVYRTLTSSRGAFQPTSTTLPDVRGINPRTGPTTPGCMHPGLGSSPFARRYSGNLVLISFPRVTEMFQFTRLASTGLCIQPGMTGSSPAGFPHSGITGSQPACGSPMLFAAYRALPRLSVPRHPPCALIRLTGYAPARSPFHPPP